MEYKIIKGRNYLLACSFSAESMALLDWLLRRNCHPIVLFVDYKEAPSSAEDLVGVKQYCAENGLVIEVCDATKTPAKEGETYQEWARQVRYDFFHEMYEKYAAAALFVPHTQDDMIEAYLLQKKSKGKDEHYGLNEINTYQGMIVVRPLLPYSFDDVMDYVKEHAVRFSEAMTIFEREHTHSAIRRETVDKMNASERERMVDEITAANSERYTYFLNMDKTAGEAQELNIREIIALDEDEFAQTLINFVSRSPDEPTLTTKKIEQIRAMCLNGKLFDSMHLKGQTYLIKEYDILTIGTNPEALPYSYTLEKPGKLETKEFTLDFSMGAEDRGIKEDSYPLTIRTVLPADQYVIGDYLYFVRALFHDWKMPPEFISRWPVFVDRNGKIVYVPTFRHGFVEYHTSVLKLHLDPLIKK